MNALRRLYSVLGKEAELKTAEDGLQDSVTRCLTRECAKTISLFTRGEHGCTSQQLVNTHTHTVNGIERQMCVGLQGATHTCH